MLVWSAFCDIIPWVNIGETAKANCVVHIITFAHVYNISNREPDMFTFMLYAPGRDSYSTFILKLHIQS